MPLASEDEALRRLRLAWLRWCVGGGLALLVGAALLWPVMGEALLRWLGPNLLALAAILGLIRKTLPGNRSSTDGRLLPRLGAGNQATLVRGILIAQLPGYLFLPWPSGWQAWLPAATLASSLIADYLDGYLARRAGEVTGFGQALDIEFDGLGLAASTALAVHYGQLPLVYFLTVGLARYLYLLAGWVVRRSGRAVHPLPDSLFRRSIAGVTMELSAAALWPIVPAAMMTVGGAIVAVPFLAGFLRDGLIHLGWIDPASPDYLAVRRETARIAGELLPPVLRVAMALLLGPLLVSAALSFPTTVEAFRRAGSAAPQLSAAVVIGLCSIALLMVVIGAAGRAAAVVILVVYGLTLALVAPSTRGLAAWGCAMGIYILGTGAGSPWQPDRPLFDRRAGERP